MANFEKLENIPLPQPDSKNQVFLEVEKLLGYLKQEYETFQETKELKKETRDLVDNELVKLVNQLTDNILTEQDEDLVKKSAQMIAQISSNSYMGIDSTIRKKIRSLLDIIDWEKWGLATDKESNQPMGTIDKTERINLLFKEIITFYNLDPQLIMSAWREGIFPLAGQEMNSEKVLKPEVQKDLVQYNLGCIIDLESERPGAALALFKNFGLANFARYPLNFLLNQYDNIDNQDLPYGVIMNARTDYNGSSYNVSIFENHTFLNFDTLDNLQNDLQGKYLLRAVEAGGRFSVIRDLINLDRRYGQNHKISFAMFRGHGDEESIGLGDWSEDKPSALISSLDITEAKWLEKIKKFFVADPTIILSSCLCGEKGGLAEKMAEKLHIKVLACDRVSGGIESIKVNEKKGHLDFKINFMAERAPLLKKVLKDEMVTRKARKYT